MVDDLVDARMRTSNARTASGRRSVGGTGDREDEMSATTRTIQQPIGKGSIFGAVAMAAAVLLAALAIVWGANNIAATRATVTPVQAPVFLDKGSRGELAAPQAAPAPGSLLDRGDRSAFNAIGATPTGDRLKDDNAVGRSATGDRLKDDNAFGATSSGSHGGLRAQ
jgi:hypothetical protein